MFCYKFSDGSHAGKTTGEYLLSASCQSRESQKYMDNLMKGRTVFVIAHRLSTIRNSDAIIVLEHGKIIERGDHKDLIRQKGTYYQLYTGKLELS